MIDFPGTKVTADRELLLVRAESPLRICSTAIVGGGFLETKAILNWHVNKGYDGVDPSGELQRLAGVRGVEPPYVGMMTAAYVEQAQTVTLKENGLRVSAIVTAGLSNPTNAGLSLPVELRAGTINMVLLVDANLQDSAMVNAVATITEAKTAVLYELGATTPEGYPATGTSTDAVVVACTGHGELWPYAGPANPLGYLLAKALRTALKAALA